MEVLNEDKVEYKIESQNNSEFVIRFNVWQIEDMIERSKKCEKIITNWDVTCADLSKSKFGVFEAIAPSGELKGNKVTIINDYISKVINPYGFQMVVDYIARNNSPLLFVNFSGCRVDLSGIFNIAEALMTNNTTTHVVLRNNYISTAGAIALGIMLQHNKTLLILDLRNSNLNKEAVCHLAKAIKVNRTLQTLDITNKNNTDLSRVKSGLKALKCNSVLINFKYV